METKVFWEEKNLKNNNELKTPLSPPKERTRQ